MDSIDYDNSPYVPNKSGEFEIYFSFIGTNDEIINSNIESFNVSEKSIELEKKLAKKIFFFSILYLFLIFSILLLDNIL